MTLGFQRVTKGRNKGARRTMSCTGQKRETGLYLIEVIAKKGKPYVSKIPSYNTRILGAQGPDTLSSFRRQSTSRYYPLVLFTAAGS